MLSPDRQVELNNKVKAKIYGVHLDSVPHLNTSVIKHKKSAAKTKKEIVVVLDDSKNLLRNGILC